MSPSVPWISCDTGPTTSVIVPGNTLVRLHYFSQRQTFVVQMWEGVVQIEPHPECVPAYIPSLQLSLDRSGWGLSQQRVVPLHN